MASVSVKLDAAAGPWASACRAGFSVACFNERGETILRIDHPRGVISIQAADLDVVEATETIAGIVGAAVTGEMVAEAIQVCRLALAEHALAALRVAEMVKSAKVAS